MKEAVLLLLQCLDKLYKGVAKPCTNSFVRSLRRDATKNLRRGVNRFLKRSAGRLATAKHLSCR